MSSVSTRFDLGYKVDIYHRVWGRHILTTSFMSTWKILGTFQGQIFVLGTKIPEN
jgi:hypothetical protein